ncbi:MAG: hypothetical protein ACXVPD_06840, partial [Bacteroidia bacterium]
RVARRGGGFALDVFSGPLNFSSKKPARSMSIKTGSASQFRPQLRLGGNIFYSSLDKCMVQDVPLAAPATGNSRVTVDNSLFGFNSALRLSLPYTCKVIPYVDVFAGVSDFSTTADIMPYSTRHTTSQPMYDFVSMDYGGAAGLMISLGKDWRLDLGVIYTNYMNQGKMVDAQTARLESGAVTTDRMATPLDMFTIKAGFTYCIRGGFSYSGGATRNSGYNRYGHSRSHWSGGHCGGGGHVNIHIR